MKRSEVYNLFAIVDAIKAGNGTVAELKPYSSITITAAVKELIRAEREACAIVAETAAQEGGALARGVPPAKRDLCLEIAANIRARQD